MNRQGLVTREFHGMPRTKCVSVHTQSRRRNSYISAINKLAEKFFAALKIFVYGCISMHVDGY
jgi:hypothetical protein